MSNRWLRIAIVFALIIGAVVVSKYRPSHVLHKVPFACQAPDGNWEDPRKQDGCEETSIIMAVAAAIGPDTLLPDAVIAIQNRLCWFEEQRFGSYIDTGVRETLIMLKQHYSWESMDKDKRRPFAAYVGTPVVLGDSTDARYAQGDVTIEGMKQDLADGYILFVPIDARHLNHPYYKSPPLAHMILIIGYDDDEDVFIVNDPGTRRGAGMHFACQKIFEVMADYKAGSHINGPDDTRTKAYIKFLLAKSNWI